MEALRDWFASADTAHATWRTSALTGCLARVERSGSVGDVQVRHFSEKFGSFLRTQLGGPFDHKPTGEKWGFIIATPLAPSHVELAWKAGRRKVDLTFSSYNVGKAGQVSAPVGVSRRLADGVSLKSDNFSIEVPMVDLSRPFEDQMEVVAEVMAAVRQLLPLVPLVLGASASAP
jgi:hypothetical protein